MAASEMAVGSTAAGLVETMLAVRAADLAGDLPVYRCHVCEDSGMVIAETEVSGERRPRREAHRCACMLTQGAARRLARAGIPRRFAEATLANFRTAGADHSLAFAHGIARGLAAEYPLASVRPGLPGGLLLCGTCGVGKTHLAVALLRELVLERAASARFWDVGDLLIQLKRSFSREPGGREAGGGSGATDARESSTRTEGQLFDEVSRVDVLVLDDLGRERPTDWAYDEINQVLSARYNANRLTIVTTNYAHLGAGAGKKGAAETLGDRIGARTHSRLQEMCRPLELVGADFRTRGGR